MDSIEDWIKNINKSNRLILVEGRKDEINLKKLGVKNKIITVSNKPLTFIEHIIEDVIILTDLDFHGRKLYSILRHNLQKRGIKIDKTFREFLFKQKISHIEGIKL